MTENNPDAQAARDKADAEIIRRYWLRNRGREPMPREDKEVACLQAAIDEARNDERRRCSETTRPLKIGDRVRRKRTGAIVRWTGAATAPGSRTADVSWGDGWNSIHEGQLVLVADETEPR